MTTVDEKALRAEARTLMAAQRTALTRAADEARRLEPYYRDMYLRAAKEDVGLDRWAH